MGALLPRRKGLIVGSALLAAPALILSPHGAAALEKAGFAQPSLSLEKRLPLIWAARSSHLRRMPKAAGVTPAVLTYRAHMEESYQATFYGFAYIPFGEAAADRRAIVAVEARDLFGGRVNRVETESGYTFSKVAERNENSGHVQIWISDYPIPSATEQNIAVWASGNLVCCAIDVWTVTGLGYAAPFSVANTASDNSTMSLTAPEGGFFVACSSQASGATCTVTGGTERSDRVIRSSYLNGCAADGTGSSVKFDWTSSSNVRAVAASFSPLVTSFPSVAMTSANLPSAPRFGYVRAGGTFDGLYGFSAGGSISTEPFPGLICDAINSMNDFSLVVFNGDVTAILAGLTHVKVNGTNRAIDLIDVSSGGTWIYFEPYGIFNPAGSYTVQLV